MGSLKRFMQSWLERHSDFYRRVRHCLVHFETAINKLDLLSADQAQLQAQLHAVQTETREDVARIYRGMEQARLELAPLVTSQWVAAVRQLQLACEPLNPPQPLYGLNNTPFLGSKTPEDQPLPLAEAIYRAMGFNVKNSRVLEVGSKLGYLSFYLADKGASSLGLEPTRKNFEAADALKRILGLPTDFQLSKLDAQRLSSFEPGFFQVALLLGDYRTSVSDDLGSLESLVPKLLEKVPCLFVQAGHAEKEALFLASRDSSKPAPWSIDVVDLPDAGSESFFLRIRRKGFVTINGRDYPVEELATRAYKDSPTGSSRTYYWSGEFFIKHYAIGTAGDGKNPLSTINRDQILREVANQLLIAESHVASKHLPRIVDFAITPAEAFVVLERRNGVLLSDLLQELTETQALAIVKSVLDATRDLASVGLFHNDIRAWNVLVGHEGVALIDLGLSSSVEKESTRDALLWLLAEIHEKRSLGFVHPRKGAPYTSASEYGITFQRLAEDLLKTDGKIDFAAVTHSLKIAGNP